MKGSPQTPGNLYHNPDIPRSWHPTSISTQTAIKSSPYHSIKTPTHKYSQACQLEVSGQTDLAASCLILIHSSKSNLYLSMFRSISTPIVDAMWRMYYGILSCTSEGQWKPAISMFHGSVKGPSKQDPITVGVFLSLSHADCKEFA